MQYQVPQFIETEDKIIGGVLTLKQFLIIAAGAGISFIFYFMFESFTWLFMTTLVGMVAVGVAFLKIQGRSVPTVMLAAFHYYWNPRFYLWRGDVAQPETGIMDITTVSEKAEAPARFTFHRKEVRQKTPMHDRNEVGIPTAESTPEEAESMPLDWSEAKPTPPPQQKIKDEIPLDAPKAASQPHLFIPGVLRGALKEANDFIAGEEAKLMSREKVTVHQALPARTPAEKTAEPSGTVPEKESEQKEALHVLEEKMLKKEELLEHEVKELENAKAKLESEIRKVSADTSGITRGVVRAQEPREAGEDTEATLLGVRRELAMAGGKVQNLWEKLLTSRASLPKRERRFVDLRNSSQDSELLRKATGEMESARRIDYSDSRHP